MKQLILAQHGHVNEASELSEHGKATIEALGAHLRRLTVDLPKRVLTSPAIPAYDSARILAEALYCNEIAVSDCLYSSPHNPPSIDATLETIYSSAETTSALIVVTHREHIRLIQDPIYRKLLGRAYPEKTIHPASAIVISLETKTVTIVS